MNNANDIFLAAFNSVLPMPEPVVEHRVYYDAVTGQCTHNTTKDEPGSYIIVTREEYDKIEFAPNWFVTKDNKLKRINVDFSQSTKLQLSNTGYCTIKDNNIFVLNEEQENTEHWDLRSVYE